MKLIDITRELTGAPVYPGDPAPTLSRLQQMALGDECDLSALSMCLHNGTHIDAPRHFVPDGDTVEQLSLDDCCGRCRVVEADGLLTGEQAEQLLARYSVQRLLLKGDVTLHPSAAFVLSDAGVRLLGVEATSVAPAHCTGEVHRQLLGNGVLLLEGLDLSAVPEGEYCLFAAPLKVAGAEGAPVRAFLAESESPTLEIAFSRHK